jgi:anti-sigma regulatory factor (Ser/Thr protein kinase)
MDSSYTQDHEVFSGDFNNAGKASRTIKDALAQLGIDAQLVRKIAIACYEAEINIIIHSGGGSISLSVTSDEVVVLAADTGPGIADIALAMTEGYSTAGKEVREMGFGAGMGLPNMKINTDEFSITSAPGKGTSIEMKFKLRGR